MSKHSFNNLDILLLGNNLKLEDLRKLGNAREKLEKFSGIILNFHIDDSNFEHLFRDVVFYQSSYIFNLNKSQKQYLEFFESYYAGISGGRDKNLFNIALLNLSYAFCEVMSFPATTKREAMDFFLKANEVKSFNKLRETGIQIGGKIFN